MRPCEEGTGLTAVPRLFLDIRSRLENGADAIVVATAIISIERCPRVVARAGNVDIRGQQSRPLLPVFDKPITFVCGFQNVVDALQIQAVCIDFSTQVQVDVVPFVGLQFSNKRFDTVILQFLIHFPRG